MNPTNRRLGKGLEALLGEGANQTIAEKTILQQPEGSAYRKWRCTGWIPIRFSRGRLSTSNRCRS